MENKIFYCYSNPLKEFLKQNNINHFAKGLHDKTFKKFWMFEGNEELNKLLTIWRNREH